MREFYKMWQTLTRSAPNGPALSVRPAPTIPSETERDSASQSATTATPGTSWTAPASPASKATTSTTAPAPFLRRITRRPPTPAAGAGRRASARNARVIGCSMPTGSASPSRGSAGLGTNPQESARLASWDTTSTTETVSTPNQTMLLQLTEGARLGTVKMPDARNAHKSGFSTRTESVFLFPTSAKPQTQRENASPATMAMTSSTEPASFPPPTLPQFPMPGADTGTIPQTAASSARAGGSWPKRAHAFRSRTSAAPTARRAVSVPPATRATTSRAEFVSSPTRPQLPTSAAGPGRTVFAPSAQRGLSSTPSAIASLWQTSAGPGIHRADCATVATEGTTSTTALVSILTPTMRPQLTEGARPGTVKMPSARNAHKSGFSMIMESVFLFQKIAGPQTQRENASPATGAMTW
jgi:hypothetical protein